MKVAISNEVHAVTNPYKSVCGLTVTKKCKPVGGVSITCPTCLEREDKRTKEIAAYIQKLLDDDSLPVDQKMWRLVGYVEGGLR